jgi:ADP-dependent phosphofructokinase/glucokinase
VIIRFGDRGIQHDADFEDLSLKLAPTAAAGLLSGLNDEAMSSVATASRHVFDLSRRWMAAGLETVHFELACYASQKAVGEVLAQGSGAVSSIGMSHSELLLMAPGANQPMDAMFALAEKLALDRVCVHADTWAAAVTRRDPEQEELALMAGCAVASARAAAGGPVQSVTIDRQAGFHPLPFVQREQRGDRSFVACAAPYVEKPATTLGLGDAFTAGCLLVLGRKKHVAVYRNLQHA